jgi:plasmid stabilization system protein ParE
VFLAAMRHSRDAQTKLKRGVSYTERDAPENAQTLAGDLARALAELQPERLIMT